MKKAALSQIEASIEGGKLTLSVEGEMVRTVSPLHGKTYSFKIGDEECDLLYLDYKIRGHRIREVWLYPINMFEENKINL